MFRVILVDDNKLTTYLLYRFTNTAAASQAKREDFIIDCYRNVAVDEILPQPTEELTFTEPMTFDVVVVMSLNCLDEARDEEHTCSLVRQIKEQCMTLKGKLAMTSIVHQELSCAAKHGFVVLSNQSIDLPTGGCSRF